MAKPIMFSENAEKSQKIRDFYNEFMQQQKAKPQIFNSYDEFRKSPVYQDLSEEEQEQFKKADGKKVMILVFEDVEQAKEYLGQLQSKGIMSKDEVDKQIEALDESESNRPHM